MSEIVLPSKDSVRIRVAKRKTECLLSKAIVIFECWREHLFQLPCRVKIKTDARAGSQN
jgi:hypothetical protein